MHAACLSRFQFKVTLCNKHLEHDWDACPFAYIGKLAVKEDLAAAWRATQHVHRDTCLGLQTASLCLSAHVGLSAGERTCRRRDPSRVNYTSNICVDMMQKGRCPRGRSCPAAHTIYE